MSCIGIDPGSTYLWLSVSGVCAGAAFSFIAVPSGRRRPAMFPLFLSAAVLAALPAFFMLEKGGFGSGLIRISLLWLGGAAAVGFIGFRFPRAAGLPLLFVLILFTVFSWYSLYNWSCGGPGDEICSFHVASEGSGYIRVRYIAGDGTPSADRIEGNAIMPVLTSLEVPEWFFIIKAEKLYRFSGFTGPGQAGAEPSELPGILRTAVGIKAAVTDIRPFVPAPNIAYSLGFSEHGTAEIKREIGQ